MSKKGEGTKKKKPPFCHYLVQLLADQEIFMSGDIFHEVEL